MTDEYLHVANLTKWFPIRGGLLGRVKANVKAVNGVSFSIRKGETFGLVGESGSGKSTIGRCILRLIDPTSGSIELDGVDIAKLKLKRLKPYRRRMQIVFQDPYASLDPRQTVKGALVEAMKASGAVKEGSMAAEAAKELIKKVGLNEDHLNRFPHEFSGGQRQRIAVARAIATNPELLILDEPTSFLDVSVQAQILNLLKSLQKEFNLTYLFISHNLAVVEHMSDRIGVMYLGKLMEVGEKRTVYEHPTHPYTYALMNAIPIPDPNAPKTEALLTGEVPSALNPPNACVFNTRCPYAKPECFEKEPLLREVKDDQWAACHFADQFRFETRIGMSK
ncbi:MAG: ABC transporter ATP-binding protein [Nitrososphaerales archaeon]